jgi:hypothetical protein
MAGPTGTGAFAAGAVGNAAAGVTGSGGGDVAGPTGTGAFAAGAVGTGAIGVGARAGDGAAGCSDAGRLVISRAPERLIGAGAGGVWGPVLLGPSPPEPAAPRSVTGAWSGPDVSTTVRTAAAFLAAAFLVTAAFLAGSAGSSGCTGRHRPSRSAFRRARSAWASSMDDEWLLTPIPRDKQRSSASLLVRPSS